jgi:hypothetical protein
MNKQKTITARIIIVFAILLLLSCSTLLKSETPFQPSLTYTYPSKITSANTNTSTYYPTITRRPSSTPSCKLKINGQYTWQSINVDIYMGPGLTLFYDKVGGGKYGNDQAGCELNKDCSMLRAHNKDSSDPNQSGVDGPWVDALTGVSIAEFKEWAVKCSLSKK